MLSEPAAADLGVSTGDQVRLQSTSGRTTALRVVAVYRNTSIVGPAVVARAAARSVGAEGTFELAALKLREGVRVGRATWHIESLANDFPKVRVHDPEEFAALNTTVADTALGVVDVLLVGSLGIGYVGMAATLTLSVHERRRELVLLRALGASREQIRRSVAVEAVALAALAAVVGLGAGTVVGWSGSELASTDLLAGGVVPVARLVVVGVGSVLVGWCATLPVARRAGRVPPLPTD